MRALFYCGVCVAMGAACALEGGAIDCLLASAIALPSMAVAGFGFINSDMM